MEKYDIQSIVPTEEGDCLYLYGVSEGGVEEQFSSVGIDGYQVYCVYSEGLIALVHGCSSKAYASSDRELVKSWVNAHNYILELAMNRFGGVMPFTFDTIIRPCDQDSASVIRKWLAENKENLQLKLAKVRDRAEYVVRVNWNLRYLAEKLVRENYDLQKLQEQTQLKSKGEAYFLKQKSEWLIKKLLEDKAEETFHEVYDLLKCDCDDVIPEKPKKTGSEKEELLKFSCLLRKETESGLHEKLMFINARAGFSVELNGPYPPYSFV